MFSREQLSEIVFKYSDVLTRIAFQRLLKIEDAEDAVQDVFVKLCQSTTMFNDDEHLKAWLIRCTINQCKDYLKAFRRRNISIEDYLPYKFDSGDLDLLLLIQSMKADDRDAIYLFYYEGYTIQEIARIKGKKVNTVNSQLQRGRKKLKQLLEV